jgi:hypothetical protein
MFHNLHAAAGARPWYERRINRSSTFDSENSVAGALFAFPCVLGGERCIGPLTGVKTLPVMLDG